MFTNPAFKYSATVVVSRGQHCNIQEMIACLCKNIMPSCAILLKEQQSNTDVVKTWQKMSNKCWLRWIIYLQEIYNICKLIFKEWAETNARKEGNQSKKMMVKDFKNIKNHLHGPSNVCGRCCKLWINCVFVCLSCSCGTGTCGCECRSRGKTESASSPTCPGRTILASLASTWTAISM